MSQGIISDRRAGLSEAKRRLLEKRLKGKSGLAQTQIIQRRKRQGPVIVSYAQQALWIIDQMTPGDPAYNIPEGFYLTGSLNVPALERSLNEIIRRHEALRTNFSSVDSQPVQIISASKRLVLSVIDLSDLPQPEKECEARCLAREEARRSFDLTADLLVRACLYRMGLDDHILMLTLHHIVADGWSMGVFYKELTALYEAFSAGNPSTLSELEVQYADYSEWEREWMKGGTINRQITYWTRQLAGSTAMIDLPTDLSRPPIKSTRGDSYRFKLSLALTDALRRLSQREGVTLYMTLLAAFEVMLFRYTGQEDLNIGTPIANRITAQIEELIGCFFNTLVIRANLSENPTFLDMLYRVREVSLEAFAHQDLPLEKLVEVVQPDRDLSRTMMFQVMFILQNAPREAVEMHGLNLMRIKRKTETSKLDLTMILEESDQGLIGELEYSTDLFEEASIKRMTKHLERILEQAVNDPQQKVAQLSLLTEGERRQLLYEWNQTAFSYPAQCFHQIFEAQVERTPDAVAVVFEQNQLSYSDLNSRSNQLAHLLCKLGVGPEMTVGLVLDRSAEMIVGLLGIMKSGGAYVPMDPDYPESRVRYAMEDAGVKVVVTQARHEGMVSESRREIVRLDRDWGWGGEQDSGNLNSGVMLENLAHVIYTSGSTGKPKGVEIEHRALVNLLWSMKSELGMRERDVIVAVTTISFDIAGLEMMLPLMVGGRVEIVSREEARDGERLKRKIDESGASVLQGTPTTWRMLIEVGWEGKEGVKILCGGEAWGRELGRELLKRGAGIWNLYGPTETTIYSAGEKVKVGEEVKIGGPIGNTQIYIVDREGEATAIGVRGEILIGGDGVGRGYLRRPEMTAERFVPDEYGGGGRRVYRTGDIGRYDEEGRIEYIGRRDEQVKVRGYRIELGEIEAVLAGAEGVSEAVVSCRESERGDKQLVAYIVGKERGGIVRYRR